MIVAPPAFTELVKGILEAAGETVTAVILYGSVARGTADSESDVDVAVIVSSPLSTAADDKLADFIVDLNLKYGKVFSVIDIPDDEFKKWREVSPFYKNIVKEGIVLWKAA